jgi:Transposase, Mutator family
MECSTIDVPVMPAASGKDVLGEVLRMGAQKLLAQAIDAEVAEWIERRCDIHDDEGHRQVVRNGYMPERTITTGVGPVEVKQPRVHDRRPAGEKEKFSSRILPPYLRKTKSIEELIPWLYLKGVSTGDFSEALAALVGPEAPGLSASTVTRLKAVWEEEYRTWSQRSLESKQYVYVWADGVHFNIRLEEDRQCILVLMGATARRHQGADRHRRWVPGVGAILVGIALELQSAGTGRGSEAGGGRWRPGFLEGVTAGLPDDARATLLGAQNGQRARQAAQAAATEGQGDAARHLASADPSRRRQGLRSLRGHLPGEVSQGHGVFEQRPNGAVGLLRLPGGALAALADHQPH